VSPADSGSPQATRSQVRLQGPSSAQAPGPPDQVPPERGPQAAPTLPSVPLALPGNGRHRQGSVPPVLPDSGRPSPANARQVQVQVLPVSVRQALPPNVQPKAGRAW